VTDYGALGRETRRAVVQVVATAGRGHVGAALSIVEILNVLFERVLRYDARRPDWPDRDRFILSKGHGCIAYYVELARKGYFPPSELERFCRPGGILGGHPDHRKIPGVETSTGSLGHGLAFGVGVALAGRMSRRDYRTFVLVGDGECNEGSVWEAALHAHKHALDRLVVLVDANALQSYGPTREVCDLEPLADKWRSFGFGVRDVDGHDAGAVEAALAELPAAPGRPTAIVCRTVKGKGIKDAENNPAWHHKSKITPEEAAMLLAELGGGRA
jgi:transketolase